MALTKRSENPIIYLEVKHYCLWRAIKVHEPACEEIEVLNPRTGDKVKKWGYRFDTVSGRATALVKYDTGQKYSTRYFGFKLHISEGSENYVLDMPYQSQVLRRFLRCARNINWSLPFSITIFKGKSEKGKKDGAAEQTGVWFRQGGDTVKPYYTKEQPHGCPEATFDQDEQKWDFKAQQRWLVERLQSETIPDIEEAAANAKPPVQPDLVNELADSQDLATDEPPPSWDPAYGNDGISDDDVPF